MMLLRSWLLVLLVLLLLLLLMLLLMLLLLLLLLMHLVSNVLNRFAKKLIQPRCPPLRNQIREIVERNWHTRRQGTSSMMKSQPRRLHAGVREGGGGTGLVVLGGHGWRRPGSIKWRQMGLEGF